MCSPTPWVPPHPPFTLGRPVTVIERASHGPCSQRTLGDHRMILLPCTPVYPVSGVTVPCFPRTTVPPCFPVPPRVPLAVCQDCSPGYTAASSLVASGEKLHPRFTHQLPSRCQRS